LVICNLEPNDEGFGFSITNYKSQITNSFRVLRAFRPRWTAFPYRPCGWLRSARPSRDPATSLHRQPYRLGVDPDAKHLFAAIHLDRDRAAAGRSLDHGLLHFLLQRLVLLLSLRHEFLQIESGHREICN